MVITKEQLQKMKETTREEVDTDQLADLSAIKINKSLNQQERIDCYLNQVGNPYMVRVGNVKVRISFADTNVSFEEAFEQMLVNV